MRVELISRAGFNIPASSIHNDVRKVLLKIYSRRSAAAKFSKITIVFVTRAESRALNSRFLSKDRPANVLSFNYGPEAELILAPALIREEAILTGRLYADELRRMTVHGLLHLLGYHHEASRKQANRFDGVERRLLRRLKIY